MNTASNTVGGVGGGSVTSGMNSTEGSGGAGGNPTAITNTYTASTSAGGSNAAAGGSGAGGTASMGGCKAPPATGSAPLIDNLEDNDHAILANEGRYGFWYQFNDQSPGGSQTMLPVEGKPGTGGVLSSSASGFVEWGAGFAVSLDNDASAGANCAYDASVYTGVQFEITTDVELLFKVTMAATESDAAHFQQVIPAGTSGTLMVSFASLVKPTWATNLATFDPAQIKTLEWQVNGPAHNITVDNVSFY